MEPERWPRAFGGSTCGWEVVGSGLEVRGPNPPPVLEPRGQKMKSGSQPISVHFGTQPPSSHMAYGCLCATDTVSPSHTGCHRAQHVHYLSTDRKSVQTLL